MPVTNYIWDTESDNVLMETDENGDTTAEYTHEPGLHGDLISQHRDGATSYHHYDGQGNTVALTDDNGDVTDTYEYNAFGETTASSGTTMNPYRFIGQKGYQYDEETENYYVRERIYEPAIARWMSPDPLGFIDGLNIYLYVGNNFTNAVDPMGLYQVTLQVDAFIPQAWVMIDPWSDLKGDDRDISRTPLGPGSSRAFSKVVVEMEKCVREEPIVPGTDFSTITESTLRTLPPGRTRYRHIKKRGTFTASITAIRTGTCSVKVKMKMNASAPWIFAPLAPGIDWEMEFDLHAFEVIGSGVILTGNQNGLHDGFPAYEAYIQDRLVYSHDPADPSQTPFSLFPPMEFSVNDNGISFRDQNASMSCCACKGSFDDWFNTRGK